jgi:hypothetical protein
MQVVWKIMSSYFGDDNLIAFANLDDRLLDNSKRSKQRVRTKVSSSSTNVKDRDLMRALCSSDNILAQLRQFDLV